MLFSKWGGDARHLTEIDPVIFSGAEDVVLLRKGFYENPSIFTDIQSFNQLCRRTYADFVGATYTNSKISGFGCRTGWDALQQTQRQLYHPLHVFLLFSDPLWTPLNANQEGVFLLSFNNLLSRNLPSHC
jgi:hypothetical protein